MVRRTSYGNKEYSLTVLFLPVFTHLIYLWQIPCAQIPDETEPVDRETEHFILLG